MSRVSFWTNLYMIQEDQVFIVDMLVIDLTRDIVASNVINWLIGVAAQLNTISKIHKYKRLHEGHHFIPTAMDVRDMDHFIKECVHLFHDRQSRGHLSLSFCIQFFK